MKEAENLLLRALAGKRAQLPPDLAFEVVAPELVPLIESDSRDYRCQRAGYILASLSTPLATGVLLRSLENRTYYYPNVLRQIHDPRSAELLGGALARARDSHISNDLVAALAQCGEAGASELRRILDSGVDGPAFGPALIGFAGKVRSVDDLMLVQQLVRQEPALEPSANDVLRMCPFSEELAATFLEYVASGYETLRKGVAGAFARWPEKLAMPFLAELKERAPKAYSEFLAVKGQIEEHRRRAVRLHKRLR